MGKESDSTRLIGVVFVALGVALLYLLVEKEEGKTELSSIKKESFSPRQAKELVNKNLQDLQFKMSLQQDQVKIENYHKAPRIQDTEQDRVSDTQMELGRPHFEGERNVYEDLNMGEAHYYESAESQILSEQAQIQEEQERRRAQIKSMKRQLIENAKRQGFRIKVNDNLEVTHSRRMGKRAPNKDSKPSSGN